MNCGDILLLLLALILPPIPVLIKVGCAGHFWLNVLLTLLGYLPGMFIQLIAVSDSIIVFF